MNVEQGDTPVHIVQARLEKAGVESARLDALVLVEYVSKIPRERLLSEPDRKLKPHQLKRLEQLVKKRVQNVPLAYLTGAKEFYGLEFKVTPSVLIPRPETEDLVSLAIKLAPQSCHLLDIGTGSGCIAVAVAKHRPDLKITATDNSTAALRVARQNAEQHKVKIVFSQSDLLKNINRKFDVAVANLPYLPTKLTRMTGLKHEPKPALDGGTDGLANYRRLFTEVKDYLKPEGLLIIEALKDQHKPLISLAKENGLKLANKSALAMVFTPQKPRA